MNRAGQTSAFRPWTSSAAVKGEAKATEGPCQEESEASSATAGRGQRRASPPELDVATTARRPDAPRPGRFHPDRHRQTRPASRGVETFFRSHVLPFLAGSASDLPGARFFVRDRKIVNIGRKSFANLDRCTAAIRENLAKDLRDARAAEGLLVGLTESFHQLRYHQKARGSGKVVMCVYRAYASDAHWAPINDFTWARSDPLPTFAKLLLSEVVWGGAPEPRLAQDLRARCQQDDFLPFTSGPLAEARAQQEQRRNAHGHIRSHFSRSLFYAQHSGGQPSRTSARNMQAGWVFGPYSLALGLQRVLTDLAT